LAERAALVTGGSSGIGLAVARALGEDGYGVTISARRPDKLEAAGRELSEDGIEVEVVPAQMTDETEVRKVFDAHRDRWGRLDVLMNNAGVGIGQPMAEIETKHLDIQLDVNLRAVIIGTREGLPLLREAGKEHGKALIVNTSSISGKAGVGWLSVYSATKAAVVGFSQATQREVSGEGVQVTALCPAFVDTPMTDFVKGQVDASDMIRSEDIAGAVRYLLSTSPACLIPEIVFQRPGEELGLATPLV
jgi:NAD(P)-dependent dehydrogenase (short-subunit alcohol dehydrogenase family)